MQEYDEALSKILKSGSWRTNQRTQIRTLSLFGLSARYLLNFQDNFPILTRRKVYPKAVFAELLWFLSGSTNNKDLKELGCNFWTPWVDHEWENKQGFAEDAFGPVYGFQLRHFGGVYGNGIGGPPNTDRTSVNYHDWDEAGNPKFDSKNDLNFIPDFVNKDEEKSLYGLGGYDQLNWVINRIKEDYSCRRTLWTLWNPQDYHRMRLPPCHMLFQLLVDDERKMTGILYQRSGDYPVGIPANIQFYSALIKMIAQQTECIPHEFVHTVADAHIYEDQIPAVEEYLSSDIIESPKLLITKQKDIFSYKVDDFILQDFNSGKAIKIPVAV